MPLDPVQKAAELKRELGPGLKVCILGGTSFQGKDSEEVTKQVAQQLHRALGSRAIFVTGGMAGVQETFAKNCGDGSRVWNLIPEGGKCAYTAGQNLQAGADLAERKAVFGRLGDVYITVEGGPGVAEEARTAFSRGATVIPLIRTGGASSGMFDFPAGALQKPVYASEENWALLSGQTTPAGWQSAAAAAVVALVLASQSNSQSSSVPFRHGSRVDRQETARIQRLTLAMGSTQALPWLAPYLERFGPVIEEGNRIVSAVGPYVYTFYLALYNGYKALPKDAALGLWGVGQCFFGGRYIAFFSAAEAFKSSGGDQLLLSLQDLQMDASAVMRANEKQEQETAQTTTASEKVSLVMRTIDPNRVSSALGGFWAGYMGIVLALKYKFARTVALAHSIGDNLRPVAAKLLAPSALAVTPPEYQQWITPSINVICKVSAMSLAWKMQRVVSSAQSGIAGGLLASRSILKLSMPYLQSKQIIDPRLLPEDSMLDEVLGWGLAAGGIYYQLIEKGSPPVFLMPLTLPISFMESWLQWSVTWLGRD